MSSSPATDPTWTRLRDTADHFAETYRDQGFSAVEITGSAIVITTSQPNRHHHTCLVVGRALNRRFDADGSGLVAQSGAYVELPGVALRRPDLGVLPLDALADDRRAVSPDALEAVVEVVGPDNPENAYTGKVRDYAKMAIARYLILDPRDGTGRVLTDPDPERAEYTTVHTFRYGESVKFAGWTVDTAGLFTY